MIRDLGLSDLSLLDVGITGWNTDSRSIISNSPIRFCQNRRETPAEKRRFCDSSQKPKIRSSSMTLMPSPATGPTPPKTQRMRDKMRGFSTAPAT
jgi:hypothetical protein